MDRLLIGEDGLLPPPAPDAPDEEDAVYGSELNPSWHGAVIISPGVFFFPRKV